MKRRAFSLIIVVAILSVAGHSAGQPRPARRVKNVTLREEVALDLSKRLRSPSLSLHLLLTNNTNGRTGFYLKRVGGAVLMSNDQSFVFYPASTIKVLEHLHALRRVQNGNVSLTTKIDIWGDSCTDDHSDESPQNKEELSESLKLMMKNSDNRRTNAIQDRFGRSAINITAHSVVGMSANSAINHKFGCQGPASDSPNRLTLVDVGRLYEKVAQRTILNGTSRDAFYQLMKNETDIDFISETIDEEALKIGLPNAQRDQFRSRVKAAAKSGGIPASYDGFLYQSTAGYVKLPFAGTCNAARFAMIYPREFVYGVFINKATNINDGTVGTAARELLRGQINSALKTWNVCPNIRDGISIPPPQRIR